MGVERKLSVIPKTQKNICCMATLPPLKKLQDWNELWFGLKLEWASKVNMKRNFKMKFAQFLVFCLFLLFCFELINQDFSDTPHCNQIHVLTREEESCREPGHYCLLSHIRQIGHQQSLLPSWELQRFHKFRSQGYLPKLSYVSHFISPHNQCLITPQFLIISQTSLPALSSFLRKLSHTAICSIFGTVQKADGIKPFRKCDPWQTSVWTVPGLSSVSLAGWALNHLKQGI